MDEYIPIFLHDVKRAIDELESYFPCQIQRRLLTLEIELYMIMTQSSPNFYGAW